MDALKIKTKRAQESLESSSLFSSNDPFTAIATDGIECSLFFQGSNISKKGGR